MEQESRIKFIIASGKNFSIGEKYIKKYVDIVSLFEHILFHKIARRVYRIVPIPGFIFNKEVKNLDCETIIVFDAGLNKKYLQYIYKHNMNKRLIVWYWNPVSTTIQPNEIPTVFEKWSYSKKDCDDFGMNFNTQFYFKDFINTPKADTAKYDIIYVGGDKNRAEWLGIFKEKCEDLGLSTLFYITKSSVDKSKKNHRPSISYNEVVTLAKSSTAILDYYTDKHAGLSLRPFESIFLEKKLITNNINIFNYDFYRKENIFVIGFDDESLLPDFIKSPYKIIDKEIVMKYDFENWLKRF